MLRHRSAAESHRVTILWIKCGRSIWSLSESGVFIHLLTYDIMPENRLCVVLRHAVRLCRRHGRIACHLIAGLVAHILIYAIKMLVVVLIIYRLVIASGFLYGENHHQVDYYHYNDDSNYRE